MRYEQVMKVKKESVDELQKLLDMEEIDFHKLKVAEDATLETFTVKFANGYEADIKVCSGQHNCFVDPVLFTPSGNECCVLEPECDILGEYWFEDHNSNEYIASLELEE